MKPCCVFALGIVALLIGCGKVSRDFRKPADEAKQQLIAFRADRITSQSGIERRRDEIKQKLEVVTAAMKSQREQSAQAVLVSSYVHISTLKEAEMLPPSEPAAREIERVKGKAEQCLKEYDALIGETNDSANENGPCLAEARAAMSK